MHRVPLTILFIIALLWGAISFGINVVHGYWLSLIPCLGLIAGIYFVSWVTLVLFRLEWKQQGAIKMILNVIMNIGTLFLELEARDREKYGRLVQLLILPPEKFKARMGSFSL